MEPPPRVRVEFLGAAGRHVLRLRGFSACWWLLPRSAKLVGDLAHALLREFELAARCPLGLDLAIDGLHVPHNQEVGVVRDGDSLAVQGAGRTPRIARDEISQLLASSSSSSSSSEEEEVDLDGMVRRYRAKKDKLEKKSKPKQKKKMKKAKRVEGKKEKAGAQMEGNVKKKAKVPELSSSSSDSSDSRDSDSSSDSSSSEDASSRRSKDEATKQMQDTKKTSPTATTGTRQAEDLDTDGKPRRRRRRQRRRRRDGNGTENASAPAVPDHTQQTEVAKAITTPPSLPSPIKPKTRFPRSKAHFRFDGTSADPSVEEGGVESNEYAHKLHTSTGLEKYGPAQTRDENPTAQGGESAKTQTTVGQRRRWGQDSSTDNTKNRVAGQRKKPKKKHEEFWKRPYEVLATVLDKPSGEGEKNVGVSELLAPQPVSSLEPSSFKEGDVIAFKTLTLCMETWQPIVSEWQCGQVASIDEATGLCLKMRKLFVENGAELMLQYDSPFPIDDCNPAEGKPVPWSELSEVRYLSGPSFELLAK